MNSATTGPKMASDIPHKGVACDAIAELIPALPKPPATAIGVVGVGLKMHFVWKDAVYNYRQAVEVTKAALSGGPFTVVASAEPYESPDELLPILDKMYAEGVRAIVLFHGSYTAGEIGSQVGRWLSEHKMPLFSWAYPENTGGRLTANSLCCQNFLLNAFKRMGVTYAWTFKAVTDPAITAELSRFARSARAKTRFVNARALALGSGRVPGFYDAECNELEVMKRFGLRFDRVDLVQVFERGKKFSNAALGQVRDAIVKHPRCGFNNVPEAQFFQTLRVALGTLDMAASSGYVGAAIRCWPDLWDHWGCAADGALSLINDYGLPAADETDLNGLISMLAMHFVNDGQSVPTLMDISLLDARRNRLGFWHCGGSATRLVRAGTKFETRRHSIMENADEATAVGMLVESMLELGPVTVTRYLSPDSACALTFEGEIEESPMAFRGAYAEIVPAGERATAEQIMGTILDRGLDHHWIIGRGHFAADLALLNHWLDVKNEAITNAGGCCGLSR